MDAAGRRDFCVTRRSDYGILWQWCSSKGTRRREAERDRLRSSGAVALLPCRFTLFLDLAALILRCLCNGTIRFLGSRGGRRRVFVLINSSALIHQYLCRFPSFAIVCSYGLRKIKGKLLSMNCLIFLSPPTRQHERWYIFALISTNSIC
jgi:hypothetical protein